LAAYGLNHSVESEETAGNDRFYFKDDHLEDPYITRNPDLRDMIKGPIITGADPFIGPENAETVITIFSDFTCAFCGRQEEILKEIISQNPEIRLSRKDYPENNEESFSFKAALAARCAFKQNKFWEYHDELYTRELDDLIVDAKTIAEELNMAARAAGLSLGAFEKCLNDSSTKNSILDNMEEAYALEITGIPYIYVNDKAVMGGVSKEGIMRMVDMAR
jgi:protein-disulfide isomerase